MMKIILVLLFELVTAACTGEADRPQSVDTARAGLDSLPDSGEGRLYIDALVQAIQASDRIVVTEHSIADDMLDPETQRQRPVGYIPVIYVMRELTTRERADLLASIRRMAVRTQDAETACTFEPHHTITFYRGEKRASEMDICFQCGQVEWDGSTKMRPWSLVPTLKNFVSKLGMQGERDWRSLARPGKK
jgi:hypothetical protein